MRSFLVLQGHRRQTRGGLAGNQSWSVRLLARTGSPVAKSKQARVILKPSSSGLESSGVRIGSNVGLETVE